MCALDPALKVIPSHNLPHHFHPLPLALSHLYLSASCYHLKRVNQKLWHIGLMEGKEDEGKDERKEVRKEKS